MKLIICLICFLVSFYANSSFVAEKVKNRELFLTMAKNKQIVFLGECDHWIKDKFEYQLALIEDLLLMGFTQIGIEDGYLDAIFINKYIQEGKLDYLSSVTTLGFIPEGTSKEVSPYVSEIVGDFPFEYSRFYTNEYLNFIKKLRILREKYDFTFFGFDIDKNPIALKKFLQKNEDEFISELYQDSLLFYKNISDASSNIWEVLASRELSMFKIVDKKLLGSERTILLGHNAHLSLNHKEYRRTIVLNDQYFESESWPTVGSYLAEKLGRDQILSVWLLAKRGVHAYSCRGKFPCAISPDKQTIESDFFVNGLDHYFIKASDINAKRKILWRENGNVLVTGKLALATDLIFFIDQVGI